MGTRGYTDTFSPSHRYYSCTLIKYRNSRLLLDCGESWLGRFGKINPHYIVITHCHPDHVWGLREGSPCPVYATEETFKRISDFPLRKKFKLIATRAERVGPFLITPYLVEHSTRCPTVALKIRAGPRALLYAPDVVYIHDRRKAFRGIDIYIGDGAALSNPMVHKQLEHLIGHASIRNQIVWCIKEKVRRAVFTHCGREVINAPGDMTSRKIKEFAKEAVEVSIAYDGMTIEV